MSRPSIIRPRMALFARIAALLLLCPALVVADTYPRQPGIDVLHYVFRLGLSDATSDITGEATLTVKLQGDLVGDIQLDLTSLTGGKGMEVQSVRRGGPI